MKGAGGAGYPFLLLLPFDRLGESWWGAEAGGQRPLTHE